MAKNEETLVVISSEDSDEVPPPPPTPPPPSPPGSGSRRFFGAPPTIFGGVLSRAQKLRDQAASEVDRLRQQQLKLLQPSQEVNEEVNEKVSELSAVNTSEVGEEVFDTASAAIKQQNCSVKTTMTAETPKRNNAIATGSNNSKSPKKQSSISPLRSAFNVVRTTSTDAAKNLIFPPAIFGSSYSNSSDDDDVTSKEDGSSLDDRREDDEGTQGDDNASPTQHLNSSPEGGDERSSAPTSSSSSYGQQLSTTPVVVKSLVNYAYSEFRTVGRYRMMKDNEPPQNVITAHDPSASTPAEKRRLAKQMSGSPVVGGANRVVGLRFLNWDQVIEGGAAAAGGEKTASSSTTSTVATITDKKSSHSSTDLSNDQRATAGGGANNDDETVSTSAEVADTASSVTSVTASEDGTSTTIPKKMKEMTRGVSYYEDIVRSTLKPGQRAMFFGQGVIGVILKPTYLASWRGVDGQGLLSATMAANKKGGVFVDSLIRGSQAYLSNVVFVGDHVVKIGTVDVSKMTLEEVIDVIANTRRPNIMVVTAVHDIELKERRFASSLDLVYGYVNKIATEGEGSLTETNGMTGDNHSVSLLDNSDEASQDNEEEVLFGAESTEEDGVNEKNTDPVKENEAGSKCDSVPVQTVTVADNDVYETSDSFRESNDDEIDTILFYASRRTNGHQLIPQVAQKLPIILQRTALISGEFRAALRLSFVECCSDPRRCKFLKCFFKRYESRKELEEKKRKEKRLHALRRETNDITSSVIQHQLLELYLALLQFHDATLICSESDRERLLTRARYILNRFLAFDDSENSDALPDFAIDIALGGIEQVLSLRRAVQDEDDFFECEDGDGFSNIRSSLEAFLSVQESYLLFLTSDVCARMRAYLRGSAPFLRVEPLVFLNPRSVVDASSHNFLLHAILHLMCMKENECDEDIDCIKSDAIILNEGNRNMGAVSLLSCAIFITRTLQKSSQAVVEGLIEDGMTGKMDNTRLYSKLMEDFQYLWEVFIAPAGGSLSTLTLSDDVQDSLDSVRRLLVSSVDDVLEKNEPSDISKVSMARVLTSVEVASSVHSLRDALFREYTLSIYPIFRRHIFHEWACQEAKQNRFDKSHSKDRYTIPSRYNGMTKGSVKRLLRQVELPRGVSLHRPSPKTLTSNDETSPEGQPVALVFGTDIPTGSGSVTSSSVSIRNSSVRRFASVSLQSAESPQHGLVAEAIPPVFETYAVVPPFHERPFLGTLRDEKNHRISVDGWEVSLTSFMVPAGSSGRDGSEWLYCVSLVFRKPSVPLQSKRSRKYFSEQEIELDCVRKFETGETFSRSTSDSNQEFRSPLVEMVFEGVKSRKMIVSSEEPRNFNRKLQEQRWSQIPVLSSDAIVGIALVSDRNQTFRMRETLSIVYSDFCRRHLCQPLVDVLGNFSHSDVEETCLQTFLEPYLSFSAAKWVGRSLREQELQFSDISGTQLMQALPPVPLALLFIAVLLEQKVVLASSRRGMLMAASDAIMQLLKPLQWKHLFVPLVPGSMMNDLVHYPAPFILGIPTDEKKSTEILSSLPEDVTIVDLDVGRVMLASEFVHDGSEPPVTARALRSQVLFLAESLGGIVGAAIDDTWAADSPMQTIPLDNNNKVDDFVSIRNICHDFVSELLSGVHLCCLWIEEKCIEECTDASEPAIVFDEERFLGIKNLRAEGLNSPLFQNKQTDFSSFELRLGIDQFDLILEAFLRTQSLSNYICHGGKESMMFW